MMRNKRTTGVVAGGRKSHNSWMIYYQLSLYVRTTFSLYTYRGQQPKVCGRQQQSSVRSAAFTFSFSCRYKCTSPQCVACLYSFYICCTCYCNPNPHGRRPRMVNNNLIDLEASQRNSSMTIDMLYIF